MSRKRKLNEGGSGSSAPFYESWSRTEHTTVKGRHTWTIDNFLDLVESTGPRDALTSSRFSVGTGKSEHTFSIRVLPGRTDGKFKDHVFFFPLTNTEGDANARCSLHIQQGDGTRYPVSTAKGSNIPKEKKIFYIGRDALIQSKDTLLPGGKLTIVCDLEVNNYPHVTSGTKAMAKPEKLPVLGPQLVRAFDNRDLFPDVTVRCGDRAFSCHKAVLAVQSEVFEAMFSHKDTKESLTSEVVIEDMEADDLKELLAFFYKGEADQDWTADVAANLLAAADKYNVPRLRSACEEILCKNMTVWNVSERLALAHLYGAWSVKAVATEFISDHLKEVIPLPGYKEIAGYPCIIDILKKKL